jgi:WD40 repeat protein
MKERLMNRWIFLLFAFALAGCPEGTNPSAQQQTTGEGVGRKPEPPARSTNRMPRPEVIVEKMLFSPDGKLLLIDYVVKPGPPSEVPGFQPFQLWDGTTGKEVRSFAQPHLWGEVGFTGAFLPDAERMLVGRPGVLSSAGDKPRKLLDEGPMYVWDVKTGEVVRTLDEGSKGVNVLAVSPDGKYAVSARRESKELELWDVASGKLLHNLGVQAPYVQFSLDSKVLYASLYWSVAVDEATRVRSLQAASFDVATGRLAGHFQAKDTDMGLVPFSPDGKLAVTHRWDGDYQKKGYLVLWDVASGKEIRLMESREGGDPPSLTRATSLAVAFSPDAKHLVSIDADKIMRRWEVATGKLVWAVKVADSDFRTVVALSPEARIACVASGEDIDWRKEIELKLWDAETGKLLRTLLRRR